MGRIPDRRTVNGFVRCPLCCGRGELNPSLPAGAEIKLVASDLGFTRPGYWRPMDKAGSIHGLHISGRAIATNGVLVILELPAGHHFIGHLANFIPVKQAKPGESRKKIDVNEGRFE